MEEAKEKKKSSEALKRAVLKYQQKFVHASINIDRDLRDRVNEYCRENETSMTKLITEYLERLVNENG